ncbi:gephyrin-like molybdotransferase receptor GlpR [Corynebacterium sp. CCM 9204]|uniref:divisome protein SepX/GlpR n=1 Tax=Corynebacterium sp. CCM 9204 TaxID=3057616 RepID=UPI003524D425
MFGTFVISLTVVVWLFVLLPLVLRNRRPIRHAGEGLEDTRIVFSGDGTHPVPRRRPRLGPIDTRSHGVEPTATDHPDVASDYELLEDPRSPEGAGEVVDADIEETTDDTPQPSPETVKRTKDGESTWDRVRGYISALFNRDADDSDGGQHDTENVDQQPRAATSARRRAAVADIRSRMRPRMHPSEQETIEILEGEVITELTVLPRKTDGSDTVVIPAADLDYDDEEVFHHDDAYTDPADLLHPAGDYSPADDIGEAYDYTHEPQGTEPTENEDDTPELTDEDIAFAARRRGRGGFDPETHDAYAAARFHRRQRILIILAVLLLAGLGIGFLFGGLSWLVPAAVGLLLGMYLYALRTQVMAEQELRARRIRQIRRARLGVRNAADAELGVPARLRRPGAIVLEIDDESPDFHELELHEGYAGTGTDENTVIDIAAYHPRRAG